MTAAAVPVAPEGTTLRELVQNNLAALRETLDLLIPEVHLQPTADRVLVMCMQEREGQTPAGIYVNVLEDKPLWRAVVLACGPGVLRPDGSRVPMAVQPSDVVIMDAFVGQYVPSQSAMDADVDLRLVKEGDLHAVLAP